MTRFKRKFRRLGASKREEINNQIQSSNRVSNLVQEPRNRGEDPLPPRNRGDVVKGASQKRGRRPYQEISRTQEEEEEEEEKTVSRRNKQMQMSGGGSGGSKMMSPKQLLTTMLIVFSTLSFIKLLLLTNSPSATVSSARPRRSAWDEDGGGGGGGNGTAKNGLAAKELALLRSVVAARAPCRLLVFGLSPQLFALAAVNSGPGAATAFVTDSAEDEDSARRVLAGSGAGAGSADVHRARYHDAAGEAWPLLRRARSSPACRRLTGTVRKSGCRLALTSLPREVLDARWDVVVVDGPSGAGPGEPGRMGAIYTAAALARATAAAGGGEVDVAVHDVDRTVERWYAWEYLCEDNLVAAKGRLWHFRIATGEPPDAFCSTGPVQIL